MKTEQITPSRRAFFKRARKAVTEVAKEVAVEKLKQAVPRRCTRPPGALDEDHFLLLCSRCDDCKDACPHAAIQILRGEGLGFYANTPYIQVKNQPCVSCPDMPCITACKTGALSTKRENPLKIATVQVDLSHCLHSQGQHCDYCFGSCPGHIKALSRDAQGNPVIDSERCTGCGKCVYICVSQTGEALQHRFW